MKVTRFLNNTAWQIETDNGDAIVLTNDEFFELNEYTTEYYNEVLQEEIDKRKESTT